MPRGEVAPALYNWDNRALVLPAYADRKERMGPDVSFRGDSAIGEPLIIAGWAFLDMVDKTLGEHRYYVVQRQTNASQWRIMIGYAPTIDLDALRAMKVPEAMLTAVQPPVLTADLVRTLVVQQSQAPDVQVESLKTSGEWAAAHLSSPTVGTADVVLKLNSTWVIGREWVMR